MAFSSKNRAEETKNRADDSKVDAGDGHLNAGELVNSSQNNRCLGVGYISLSVYLYLSLCVAIYLKIYLVVHILFKPSILRLNHVGSQK